MGFFMVLGHSPTVQQFIAYYLKGDTIVAVAS